VSHGGELYLWYDGTWRDGEGMGVDVGVDGERDDNWGGVRIVAVAMGRSEE
jgi:hypothetical protein